MKKYLATLIVTYFFLTSPVLAADDPRTNQNNKVGINILSPEAEIEEAASMINNNGDWGWVLVIIKKDERNVDRWQSVLNQLNKNHLIPIIRLATHFNSNGVWQKPTDEDALSWADFLSKLHFPTKNRYIQVYNEVNHAPEWGGQIDAAGYAKELNKSITALKDKSPDFFILNSPLDLAADNSKNSLDASIFFKTMESAVPGIFKKLDGWASHSYPNPNFSASPYKSGRTGIDGFNWELTQIAPYLENKDLPVFVTETGWKRTDNSSEGLSEEQIAAHFKVAFENVWNSENVVAVTPFVLNYPHELYRAFSFKTTSSDNSHYKYFQTIRDLPKVKGDPVRNQLAQIIEIDYPDLVIKNDLDSIKIKIKNIGNFIWNINNDLKLTLESENIHVDQITWSQDEIFPGQETTATIQFKSNTLGNIPFSITLANGSRQLAKKNLTLTSETLFSLFLSKLESFLGKIG